MGFYWYAGTRPVNSLNKELLYAIDYVHQLGYYIMNLLPGRQLTQWEKVGFDVANMQPNYMFGSIHRTDTL